jgi:hypothetical protein
LRRLKGYAREKKRMLNWPKKRKKRKKKAEIEVGDVANSKGKEKGFVRIAY